MRMCWLPLAVVLTVALVSLQTHHGYTCTCNSSSSYPQLPSLLLFQLPCSGYCYHYGITRRTTLKLEVLCKWYYCEWPSGWSWSRGEFRMETFGSCNAPLLTIPKHPSSPCATFLLCLTPSLIPLASTHPHPLHAGERHWVWIARFSSRLHLWRSGQPPSP